MSRRETRSEWNVFVIHWRCSRAGTTGNNSFGANNEPGELDLEEKRERCRSADNLTASLAGIVFFHFFKRQHLSLLCRFVIPTTSIFETEAKHWKLNALLGY